MQATIIELLHNPRQITMNAFHRYINNQKAWFLQDSTAQWLGIEVFYKNNTAGLTPTLSAVYESRTQHLARVLHFDVDKYVTLVNINLGSHCLENS